MTGHQSEVRRFAKCKIQVLTAGLLLLLTTLLLSAEPIDEWFQAGNDLYAQGDFEAATEQYLRIVETGFAHEAVYYNLANAYFKDDELGRAILYYRKARDLAPGDRDIAENLALAQARIVDKVEGPAEGFLERQWNRLVSWLTIDQETLLAVALFIVSNTCFAFFLLLGSSTARRVSLYVSAFCLLGFLVVGSSNLLRIYQRSVTQEAVVLEAEVEVRSGPGADNPTLFAIHEGLKVNVRNEMQDWIQISLDNGWNGWVRKEALGRI